MKSHFFKFVSFQKFLKVMWKEKASLYFNFQSFHEGTDAESIIYDGNIEIYCFKPLTQYCHQLQKSQAKQSSKKLPTRAM